MKRTVNDTTVGSRYAQVPHIPPTVDQKYLKKKSYMVAVYHVVRSMKVVSA